MIVRRKRKARDRLEIIGLIGCNVRIEPHLDAQKVVSDVVNGRKCVGGYSCAGLKARRRPCLARGGCGL
jgi:hypothetical protein